MIAYMEGLSLTEADNLKKTISKLFPADLHCADAV